jgi:hypothetical protein
VVDIFTGWGHSAVPRHNIQDRVKTAYNEAREGDESSGVNPINKVQAMKVWYIVSIDELPHEEHPEAVVGSGDATDRSAGRLTISGNGIHSFSARASDCTPVPVFLSQNITGMEELIFICKSSGGPNHFHTTILLSNPECKSKAYSHSTCCARRVCLCPQL